MRVGVVMPTYNQAKFLYAALGGVDAQDILPDLVIVDDASTDETWEIVRRLPFCRALRRTTNGGTAEAINAGVGPNGMGFSPAIRALSWISSDNVMTPDWLTTLVPVIEGGAGVAYGGFWYVKDGHKTAYHFKQHQPEALLNTLNCYYGPAFLIRKDVWLEAGEHRGRISHDYDHWLRVEEACFRRGLPIVGVDKPLCFYNAHPERATVKRAHEFDADHWQAEARKRRGVA